MKLKTAFLAVSFIASSALASPNLLVQKEPSRSPVCSAANAKAITFRYAEKYADQISSQCIKISGFVRGGAIHKSKAIALSKAEPDWQTIGLQKYVSAEDQDPAIMPRQPQKATVIGTLGDCGSKNWPHYCHYVGGPIIDVISIDFGRKK